MADHRRARGSLGRDLLRVAAGVSCLFLAGFVMLFWNFKQDTVWKWRVRGKVKPHELRAWAFQVLSNSAAKPDFQAEEMLTNAPAYITDIHQPEMVLSEQDHVEVVYGGGLYHWGLTIGGTNLPPAGWEKFIGSRRGRPEFIIGTNKSLRGSLRRAFQ